MNIITEHPTPDANAVRVYGVEEQMNPAIAKIRDNRITDINDAVRILMERAEVLSPSGPQKKQLVLQSYNRLSQASDSPFRAIPVTTVAAIIEAIIYATTTAIAVNKKTGCWEKFMALFKKPAV